MGNNYLKPTMRYDEGRATFDMMSKENLSSYSR